MITGHGVGLKNFFQRFYSSAKFDEEFKLGGGGMGGWMSLVFAKHEPFSVKIIL
jgi:hypothetical protein